MPRPKELEPPRSRTSPTTPLLPLVPCRERAHRSCMTLPRRAREGRMRRERLGPPLAAERPPRRGDVAVDLPRVRRLLRMPCPPWPVDGVLRIEPECGPGPRRSASDRLGREELVPAVFVVGTGRPVVVRIRPVVGSRWRVRESVAGHVERERVGWVERGRAGPSADAAVVGRPARATRPGSHDGPDDVATSEGIH